MHRDSTTASRAARGLIALAMAAALGAPAALAQDSNAAGSAPAAANAPAPEWFKLCGKDEGADAEVCSVQSFALADAGNVVAEVRILEVKAKDGTRRVFESLIPVGFLIPPGVNLVIDENKPLAGRYRICFPNGCLVEAQINDEFIASLKRGGNLVVFAANQQGSWVGARVSLNGFTKAFDGPATDPKAYEEWRKNFEEGQNNVRQSLQSGLMRRAEEQRQRLQGQGGGEAGDNAAPTPAPAQQ